MPLTVIKGEYVVIGASPDGDSVRFYPSTPDAWRKAGLRIRTNKAGGGQLRLDGIDSLETHYSPRLGELARLHQPREHADHAAEYLLHHLGFADIERDEHGTVIASTPARTPGFVMTRFADAYGRCVAFAFPGSTEGRTLSDRWLDTETLEESANHAVLAAGLAYPTYYSRLYPDLREAMTATVAHARAAGDGIWKSDVTTTGFDVGSLEDLTDDLVIMPKLFRRLVDYLAINNSDMSLDGFHEYLTARQDRLFIISEGRVTGFDNVVQVAGQRVKLINPPEDLIFIEAPLPAG